MAQDVLLLVADAAAAQAVAAETETTEVAKVAAKEAAAATAGSNGSGDAVEPLLRRENPGTAARERRVGIAGME